MGSPTKAVENLPDVCGQECPPASVCDAAAEQPVPGPRGPAPWAVAPGQPDCVLACVSCEVWGGGGGFQQGCDLHAHVPELPAGEQWHRHTLATARLCAALDSGVWSIVERGRDQPFHICIAWCVVHVSILPNPPNEVICTWLSVRWCMLLDVRVFFL